MCLVSFINNPPSILGKKRPACWFFQASGHGYKSILFFQIISRFSFRLERAAKLRSCEILRQVIPSTDCRKRQSSGQGLPPLTCQGAYAPCISPRSPLRRQNSCRFSPRLHSLETVFLRIRPCCCTAFLAGRRNQPDR